jgi:predicted transposase YbfD/YdcC
MMKRIVLAQIATDAKVEGDHCGARIAKVIVDEGHHRDHLGASMLGLAEVMLTAGTPWPHRTRTAALCSDDGWLEAVRWPGVAAIGTVVRTREMMPKTTIETVHYRLTVASPELFKDVVRPHWGVRQQLSWHLDLVTKGDQDRSRLGHAPQDHAVLRHMALNGMQEHGTTSSRRSKVECAGRIAGS